MLKLAPLWHIISIYKERGPCMRRFIVAAIVVLFILGVAVAAFADGKACPMGEKGAKGVRMGMCPMHCMMMKDMMKKEIVATDDGSVVVMVGNKLMKYDKNLELKKEVEIKCDMKDTCDKMCKDCPCCQEMKERHEMKECPAMEKAEHVMKKGRK